MKKEVKIGLIGTALLIVSAFLPLASMNGRIITILPVFNNIIIQNVWRWIDISAFTITYIIGAIVCVWFVWEEKFIGIFIVISAVAFVAVIIFMGILFAQVNANPDELKSFSIEWGWVIIAAGVILVYNSGFGILKRIKAKKNYKNT